MNEGSLIYDFLKETTYPDIESVTSVINNGTTLTVNINIEGFFRKEGITIEVLDLIAFIYSKITQP